MSLIAVLVGGLRVLLRAACVFLALGMIALTVMFGSSTVRLGGVFVVFGRFVVLISRHFSLVGCQLPAATTKSPRRELFLSQRTFVGWIVFLVGATPSSIRLQVCCNRSVAVNLASLNAAPCLSRLYPFRVKGGCSQSAGGAAGVPPASEITARFRDLRFVPSDIAGTAARPST